MSALRASHALPGAIVRLEGLGKLKKFNETSGIEPVTFQIVA
jgi:hypothetical protein